MKFLLIVIFFGVSLTAHSQYAEIWLESNDTTLTDIWIDSSHSFDVHVDNNAKAISFSSKKGKRKTTKGRFNTTLQNVDAVRLQDLNCDGTDEIIASTGRNMNGNQWFDIFMFIAEKNTITYCGSFNTDYEIDCTHKTIKVTFTGSWYMARYKKVYVLRDRKLVPDRMMSISLKDESMDCDSIYVEQYEGTPVKSNQLKRTYKKMCASRDKDIDEAWQHFFDQ